MILKDSDDEPEDKPEKPSDTVTETILQPMVADEVEEGKPLSDDEPEDKPDKPSETITDTILHFLQRHIQFITPFLHFYHQFLLLCYLQFHFLKIFSIFGKLA